MIDVRLMIAALTKQSRRHNTGTLRREAEFNTVNENDEAILSAASAQNKQCVMINRS